jgi:hypothetical protein
MEVMIGDADAEPGVYNEKASPAAILLQQQRPLCGSVAATCGANYNSDTVSGDSDLDSLDYQSSGSTVDGKGGSGGRRSHVAIPAIMRRHLNCMKTVQMFKLSGGIFSLQSWMNHSRGQLRFSNQLNRRKGRRNCPGPDAINTEEMVASAVSALVVLIIHWLRLLPATMLTTSIL